MTNDIPRAPRKELTPPATEPRATVILCGFLLESDPSENSALWETYFADLDGGELRLSASRPAPGNLVHGGARNPRPWRTALKRGDTILVTGDADNLSEAGARMQETARRQSEWLNTFLTGGGHGRFVLARRERCAEHNKYYDWVGTQRLVAGMTVAIDWPDGSVTMQHHVLMDPSDRAYVLIQHYGAQAMVYLDNLRVLVRTV